MIDTDLCADNTINPLNRRGYTIEDVVLAEMLQFITSN